MCFRDSAHAGREGPAAAGDGGRVLHVSSLDVQEGSTGPTSRAPGGRDGPREQVIEIPDFLHRC